MNPLGPLEIEVKLRIPSTAGFAERLLDLGFVLEVPAQRECSVLWDRGTELFAHGCALRTRTHGGKSSLTWKGPKTDDPLLKIRPELETEVAAVEATEAILRALGYAPVMTMQKVRAVFRRDDLVACLDETPFGCYLELEGEPEAIHPVMAALGLGPELAEVRSYPTLFRLHGLA
jgi:adenylate cyclase, class 2